MDLFPYLSSFSYWFNTSSLPSWVYHHSNPILCFYDRRLFLIFIFVFLEPEKKYSEVLEAEEKPVCTPYNLQEGLFILQFS